MKKAKKMTKTSAVIAEYNPFHNGHKYNLEQIKNNSSNSCVAVIMSGNFTQRGEIAVMDKYTRATHAIKAGADIVVELPTVYATANAEIFALGGVKVFKGIGATTLCFGAEKADKQEFLSTAKLCLNETKEFKNRLKTHLKSGYKFAKAKSLALCELANINQEMLLSPNNILGVEYTKALLSLCPTADILPILRVGSGYNDTTLKDNFSSASAIRKGVQLGEDISSNVPPFVLDDMPKTLPNASDMIMLSVIQKSLKELKNLPDCTEGLENRIYKMARQSSSLEELLEKTLCKRYTKTRLQRILICSLLGINKKIVTLAKKTTPYIKVLAIKKDKMHKLSEIAKSATLITRSGDEQKLNKKQLSLFKIDKFAGEVYSLITNSTQKPFEMKII